MRQHREVLRGIEVRDASRTITVAIRNASLSDEPWYAQRATMSNHAAESSVSKLLAIAGSPLGSKSVQIAARVSDLAGRQTDTLLDLLSEKNGFLAFESALHMFPSGTSTTPMSLEAWNAAGLWRDYYDGLDDTSGLCFAEDIFGEQFILHDGGVRRFNPETGESEYFATNLEEWCQTILTDYRIETGWPLAHEWQVRHGALPLGQRLLPKVPFVLGGAYAVDNLYALNAVEGMRVRAHVANQIRNLPDGARIRLRTVD